jgi:hypothetical protein
MTQISISCGGASKWVGEADLVLTNPYAPLPECLWGKPSFISLYIARNDGRLQKAQQWIGGHKLYHLSYWGQDSRNAVYIANMNFSFIGLSDLVEDYTDTNFNEGWFPLALPLLLLARYAGSGLTVWDGFCGRGTVGRACRMLGLNYIGIDINPSRVEYAKKYVFS